MAKISTYKEILIVMMIIILAGFFPLTGHDFVWATANIENIEGFFKIANGSTLATIFSISLAKLPLLRLMFYGVSFSLLILLMKSSVDKKNGVLSTLSLFLILLIDKSLFGANIANLSRFVPNILSIIAILSLYNLFTKDCLYKVNSIILFLIGLLVTSVTPTTTFIIFLMTLYYLYKNRKFTTKKEIFLLLGVLTGTLFTVFTTNMDSQDIFYNLYHNLLPTLHGSNFLITFILSTILILKSFKLFEKTDNPISMLPILGIVNYLVVSLVEFSEILYYISYIIYLASCYHILKNDSKGTLFVKVTYLFLIKISYFILALIIGESSVTTLIPVVLDILIILEIYDRLFPKGYLNFVWTIGLFALLSSNIYIYRNIFYKYDRLSFEIKNKLECQSGNIVISNRYKTEYLIEIFPSDKDTFESYVKYYDIKLRIPNEIVKIHFKN